MEIGIRSVPGVADRSTSRVPGALRQIAELYGWKVLEAESLDRLKTASAAIAEAMGKRYVPRYTPGT